MPRFSVLAATSEGAGFQYYQQTTFSFTKGGVFLPHVSGGTFSHSTSTFSVVKPTAAGTKLVNYNLLLNTSVTDPAGRYIYANGGNAANVNKGSAGGFPIFYRWTVYSSSDANNLNISLDVGNPSAVNDVTSDSITISGYVFFYLAPF